MKEQIAEIVLPQIISLKSTSALQSYTRSMPLNIQYVFNLKS
jgi:hypothetical protein